ncbi:MAG: HD domain-containing protein [Armatimonadota bacterium]
MNPFSHDGGYLRLPIWGHIPLSAPARRIIEHPDFARLAKIRQLAFVYYVFPGASHTRFEHSVGTYHLASLELARLPGIEPLAARTFLAAALLHDIGHYPFGHLVDRLPGFASHEDRAGEYILGGEIARILREDWEVDPEAVAEVIARPDAAGLPGKMLSGILDPDKMDYLMRDAWACAVPYGNIDVDRLIESLVLDGERLAITDKGVAPLESLVFAKYMMFRHIYWHHAVRIAAAMFTRFVQDTDVEPEDFYRLSDDALVEHLTHLESPSRPLIEDLASRRLYKRGITFYAEHAVGEEEFAVTGRGVERIRELYARPDLRREKERTICRMLGVRDFDVLLDIPRVDSVFDVEDFRELRVRVKSQAGRGEIFVPFNSYGFTQLTADFAQEFERFSRRLQVICRPDLVGTVAGRWKEIKALVEG